MPTSRGVRLNVVCRNVLFTSKPPCGGHERFRVAPLDRFQVPWPPICEVLQVLSSGQIAVAAAAIESEKCVLQSFSRHIADHCQSGCDSCTLRLNITILDGKMIKTMGIELRRLERVLSMTSAASSMTSQACTRSAVRFRLSPTSRIRCSKAHYSALFPSPLDTAMP